MKPSSIGLWLLLVGCAKTEPLDTASQPDDVASKVDAAAAPAPRPAASRPSFETPCDDELLLTTAREIATFQSSWSARSGVLPWPSTRAASAIWRACQPELDVELRWILDRAIAHPIPEWRLERRPTPKDPPDPLEAQLPGHTAYHEGSKGRVPKPRASALCPDLQAVANEAEPLSAPERPAVYFKGCDLARLGLYETREVENEDYPIDMILQQHVLAAWMLDLGVPKDVVRPLVRVLRGDGGSFELDPHIMAMAFDDGLRLPKAAKAAPPRLVRDYVWIGPTDVGLGFVRLGTLSADDWRDDLRRRLTAEGDLKFGYVEGKGVVSRAHLTVLVHREVEWSVVQQVVRMAKPPAFDHVWSMMVLVDDVDAPVGLLDFDMAATWTAQGMDGKRSVQSVLDELFP